MQLHYWMIPAFITLLLVVINFRDSNGPVNDLGDMIGSMVGDFIKGIVSIIAILFVWLAYFIFCYISVSMR